MINKEEVEFNAKSLVSVWLTGAKDISNMYWDFLNKDTSEIVPCNSDNAADILSDVLINQSKNFNKGVLHGTKKGIHITLGVIDID